MQNDTTKNPTPAPGQVWRWREGGDPTIVIDRVDYRGMIYGTGRAFMEPAWLLGHYECIGIETPAGRVVVGERRRARHLCLPADHIAEVLHVINGTHVAVKDDDGEPAAYLATDVATWPIATEPAPGVTNGRWDWDRASVRDFKMPIPFAMASGPRMPMPEATAEAQKACGCALCKSHTQQTADVRKMIAEWRVHGVARPGYVERIAARMTTSHVGSRAWLLAEVTRIVPVLQADIVIEEEPKFGRVSVRLPAYVHPGLAAHLQQWLDSRAPVTMRIGVFVGPKPDPRAAREQRRREIDAVLCEDARRSPAFATARQAALLCDIEGEPSPDDYTTDDARLFLEELHEYEAARGGATRPIIGDEWRVHDGGPMLPCIIAYERARSAP